MGAFGKIVGYDLMTNLVVKYALEDKGYDFYMLISRYLIAPAGISESIRQKLEDALRKAAKDPNFLNGIKKLGITPQFVSGSECEKQLQDVAKVFDRLRGK